MLKSLLFLSLLSKLTLAALQLPGDINADFTILYVYEQACHHHATEKSTIRYDSPAVQSKMFLSYYSECLTAVWPKCQVLHVNDVMKEKKSFEIFKDKDTIGCDVSYMRLRLGNRPGFFAGELSELDDRWFISWDPSMPKTDVQKFSQLKLAGPKTLYKLHLLKLTRGIKKFQNAGAIESLDNLCLIKNPLMRKKKFVGFQQFRAMIESSLTMIRLGNSTSELARGDISEFILPFRGHLPPQAFHATVTPIANPKERVQLLYPYYTVIKPGFPIAIHYMLHGMAPPSRSYARRHMSFIAAAFDEKGDFVSDPNGNVFSYLTIAFDGVIL